MPRTLMNTKKKKPSRKEGSVPPDYDVILPGWDTPNLLQKAT
jgi:hypothetical protein